MSEKDHSGAKSTLEVYWDHKIVDNPAFYACNTQDCMERRGELALLRGIRSLAILGLVVSMEGIHPSAGMYSEMETELRNLDQKIEEEKNRPSPPKEMTLKWKPVPRVKEYHIEINSPDNKPIKEIVTTRTVHKEMLPAGKYPIRLRSVDRFGRAGEWSPYTIITLSLPKENINLTKLLEEKEKKNHQYRYARENKTIPYDPNPESGQFCRHFSASHQMGSILYADGEIDISMKNKFSWNILALCENHTHFPWLLGFQTGYWHMNNGFQNNLSMVHGAVILGGGYSYGPFRADLYAGYGYSYVELYYKNFEFTDDNPYFLGGLAVYYRVPRVPSLSIMAMIQFARFWEYGDYKNAKTTDDFWTPSLGVEYRFF